jgi:hypothetical protein
LDSTTIDLCISLFPWATFRQHKGAVKLHTLLDLHGNIPTFVSITDGTVHDVSILDEIMPEAGAFYLVDRGHVDFKRLYVFTLSAAFFVVHTKSNVLLHRLIDGQVFPLGGVFAAARHHVIFYTAEEPRIKMATHRNVSGQMLCCRYSHSGSAISFCSGPNAFREPPQMLPASCRS